MYADEISAPLAGWTVPRSTFKRFEIVGDPATPPIDLNLVKSHLRITDSDNDQYLNHLMSTAFDACERYTQRQLVTRTVRMWMDIVPGVGEAWPLGDMGTQSFVPYLGMNAVRWFALLKTPAHTVTAITFYQLDDSAYIMPTTDYLVDSVDLDQPARILLRYGAIWPVNIRAGHAISVDYSVGYPTAAAVPTSIRQAVLIMAAALWSNRGDNADAQADVLQFPGVKQLLDPFRVRRISTL